VPGYEIASHYEAAYEIGGDFFDLFRRRTRGRPLSIVVADVTGKGIAAALLMAFSRPLLHAAIDHTTGPVEALERTNHILVQERRSALFLTVIAAELHLRSGALRVANAGHEPPLVVRADGSIEAIEPSGVLLGAFESIGVVECGADLEPGDTVVLYTDGVTDARSVDGERFGEERLFDAVHAGRGDGAAGVIAAVRDAVERFQAGVPPADDVTLVALRREPARGRGRTRR
jgi:sigma-B regulation protein RsbU (phosphoserine phosphatase)